VGEILLRSDAGEEALTYSDHNLYLRSLNLFHAAIQGQGRPAADGIDGIKSLAVAAAVAKAAKTGQRTTVDYGGV
jgi:1,5-anhydro-D-fructose reductase (1,5-anhydro-D-mannitol-forming)